MMRRSVPVLTVLTALLALTGPAIAQASSDYFLHGTGPDNNPPTLLLNPTAPTAATAKFRDSASVNFSGGNAWKEVGTWPVQPTFQANTVTALSDLHVWLGLKNSDDQGTQFDLKADVFKNGTLVSSGLTRCLTGIVRTATNAKEATVTFASFSPVTFNGTTDTLALKISARIGTNPDDTKCPGHNNAVGLRLYFDATTRTARFDVTTGVSGPTITSLTPASLSLVAGTTGPLTVTISTAQPTETTVAVSSNNADVASVPGTVTVPANQMTASLIVTAVASGTAQITASLNATSAGSTLTVANPVPSLVTLSPASVPSGSPNTTLTITGQSFVSGATVTFSTTALTTTFVSATQLTAVIPATLLATKSTGQVTVENPAPGGGLSNSLPFMITNGPPQLAPIGNQTVPLGSTLTFTTTATDPDNDPVTFAVTPLPLPNRATFNSQTGQFIFSPLATQVGTLALTFVATDGIAQQSETITVTVTGAAPGGTTGVSGRVVDGSGLPIANLPVSVKGTLASTATTAQGQFTLNNLAVSGRQVLLANGFAQGYAILAAPVDLIPNVVNQLPSDLRVPVLDMASAVTVNPNATTVLGNPTFPAVSVTIPPHTAKNPDGTDYTGVLTISPVPEYGRPESRPVELKPGFSITIQPAGITFTTPAPITLPNTDNLPVGNEFDLWSLSPDTGTFYVAGRMRVSADGSKLETISGGVQKTAWHFALAFAAQLLNDLNRIIGGCTTCTMASGGDLTEGTLTQDVSIPGIRTLGVSRDLTLHYTSTTADVRPILPVTATLPQQAAVPSTFSAELTVGGLKQGNRGYWDASVMNELATSTTRLGVQYDASPLPTGRYPYELLTASNYTQSSIGAISRGFTMIRNEQQSSMGAGWTLMGVDRLIPAANDTLLLASGDGRTVPFVNASTVNLVSWWPAEGSAVDSRSGINGTLQNGVTFTTGELGQAFSFDGVNDVISVPHNVAHNPPALTIAGWVNITQAPATGQEYYLVSKYDGNFNGYILRLGSTLVPTISLQRAPNVTSHTTAAIAIPLNTWVHLAATYDGTTASIYIDGALQGSSVLNGGYSGATVPMAIGAASWFNGGYTKGFIDEVELYAQAVPASQVNALFTAGGRKDLAADFLAPPSEYSSLKKNLDGTYTRTLKDGTTYQFNVQGVQTSLADRNGNSTTYAYNGSTQLTTITDPAGQVTTLGYNGNLLATVTDPAGRVTQLTHDSAGNLTTVDSADQTHQSFVYDPQHRLIQRTDAQNKVYAYQFDHAGRLQRATLPGGAFREIRPTELTAVPNLAAGQGTPANPATLTQPPIVQATYKDARGNTTTFETDAIGHVTKQIDPANRTTTITRDPQGNPLVITRPNGAVTTMIYDAKGNLLTSTEQSIAATTAFTYDPTFNQVTSIRDPKNNLTSITYDAKGNPLTITDADNKVTTFTYDSRGLLLTSKDALNNTTTFTYNAQGRLLTTTDPLNRTTTLTYDNAGNVATSTDALTRVTMFQYDQKNRLKQVTDPATGVTRYTYDGNGNLLTVKDAKNQTTTFAYDDRNRLLSTTDPLGKVETYTYDGNDNLLTRVTPKAETISFAYDAVNQLLSKTLPSSQLTSYQYDLVGNLTNVTDPDSVLAMTYDQANRLLTTATAGSSNQPAVTLTYTHDKNSNRLTAVDPAGTNTYVYDVLNRLTSLTNPAGATTFGYDALSHRTSMTFPNGTSTTYTYDPASQVTTILHQLTATSTPINQAAYAYNPVGNRTSLTDRRGAQNFGYDTLDRLTSASHPLLGTPQAFAYDPVGNRTTGGSIVNAGNQLTADANYAYQYDDNGNLTRKTLLATGNFTAYTYDAENRLTKVEDFVAGNPTAVATSTYRYDGLGRRIEKVANGQTRRYVYDFEDILLEYDGANTLLARYTHGPGIDEPVAMSRSGSTFFYHADALGSVSELTDGVGTIANSYAYDAFGNILDQSGTVGNAYTYAGRELDSESGLYYFRTRYYDPRIGRFLRKDPIGLIAGVNLYAFVGNNPVNRLDPWGLFPLTDCVKGILAPYFPGLNLDLIDIHEGLPWYTRDNVLAITRGNDIYFGPGKYDPHSRAGIGLIGHETAHVGQYAEYGDLGFLLKYGSDYLKNRLQGMDEDEAYENIPFEREARAKAEQIRDDLKKKYGNEDPCPEPGVCHADYE